MKFEQVIWVTLQDYGMYCNKSLHPSHDSGFNSTVSLADADSQGKVHRKNIHCIAKTIYINEAIYIGVG